MAAASSRRARRARSAHAGRIHRRPWTATPYVDQAVDKAKREERGAKYAQWLEPREV